MKSEAVISSELEDVVTEQMHAAIAAARSQMTALAAIESQLTEMRSRAAQATAQAEAAEERARQAERRLADLESRIQLARGILGDAQAKVTELFAGLGAAMAAPEPEPYRLTRFVEDLRVIAGSAKTHGELFRRTEPLVKELVTNKEWLRPEHFEIDPVQGFGVHCLHEEPNHDLAIFAVCFAPGKGAPPHDHGTWAVVGVVEGEEQNTFWKRVDDGARDGVADLRKGPVKMFKPGDVGTFTPDLIHSLDNVTDKLSLSLHVYGRHLNHASRSKFDPANRTVEPFIVRVAADGVPEHAEQAMGSPSNGIQLPPAPKPIASAAGSGAVTNGASTSTSLPSVPPPARNVRPPWRRGAPSSTTTPPVPSRFNQFVNEIRKIMHEAKSEQEILRRAQPLVKEAARAKDWLRPEHYDIDPVQGFGVHCLHEEPNHDLGIFAVAFAPGKGAPPHDHGTWAVVAVVDGEEYNTMWRRVDDGSMPGRAELRNVGSRVFKTEDVAVFTSDLIHSLDNQTDRISLSFHVYGRHLNHASRLKFDPSARTVEPFIVNVASE